MKLRFIFWLAITLALSTNALHARADNAQHQFAVYDRGQDSCGQLLQARKFDQQENTLYQVWLAGYITAYNHLTPDTADLINMAARRDPAPLAGPIAWIEKYCAENPMASLMSAVISFTTYQYPNRGR